MPVAFTPLNILSGFKKCGIQPLNPGEVSDRSLAPSKAVSVQPSVSVALLVLSSLQSKKHCMKSGMRRAMTLTLTLTMWLG